MDDVLILTGFMGVGKSATGRILAQELGWAFADLDREVEEEAGRSVPRIFAEDGEARFRELEAESLARVLGRRRVVVATGGGVLLREENRRRLRGYLVVNLDAPAAECLRRVRSSGDPRPLLSGPDPEGAARALYEARSPAYRSVERQVDTVGKSPRQVAREIRERFLDPPKGEARS